jgi:hypothetical protein
MYGSDGPLWYRGWALNDEAEVCREVDAVLEKTGTRRMIMGHTPNFEVCEFLLRYRVTLNNSSQKIVSRCNGKIIIIDTGEYPS